MTYLDHVHLEAVDHPAAAEVFPDEKFTFPPFPAPRIHAVVAPLVPRRALGSDGKEWTAELAANDLRFAAPFTPYHGADAGGPASTGQFPGSRRRTSSRSTSIPRACRRAGRCGC